jgi:hypothetical protein
VSLEERLVGRASGHDDHPRDRNGHGRLAARIALEVLRTDLD